MTELPTKSYVDSLHESIRNGRDLSSVFKDQDNDVHTTKLTNLDSVSVKRNPISDNELVIKKYLDDELDKNFVLRFNKTLQNYLKVTVGSDTYNFTKDDKKQNAGTSLIKYPNTGGYLLQNWVIKYNVKKILVK